MVIVFTITSSKIFQRNCWIDTLSRKNEKINFRHIPVIAKALHDYKGAMILVSHVPDFVSQIRIDEVLDLSKGRK